MRKAAAALGPATAAAAAWAPGQPPRARSRPAAGAAAQPTGAPATASERERAQQSPRPPPRAPEHPPPGGPSRPQRNVDGHRFEDGRYAAFTAEVSTFLPKERQYTDPVRTLAYGTDASFYRLNPKMVLKVRTPSSLPPAHARHAPAAHGFQPRGPRQLRGAGQGTGAGLGVRASDGKLLPHAPAARVPARASSHKPPPCPGARRGRRCTMRPRSAACCRSQPSTACPSPSAPRAPACRARRSPTACC